MAPVVGRIQPMTEIPWAPRLDPRPEALLSRAERAFSGRTFLVCAETGRTLTFSGLAEEVARAAAVLRARGVGRRDVVSLFLGNSLDFFAPWLGAVAAGGIANPINLGLARDVGRVVYMLEKTSAKVFILEKAFADLAREVKKARRALQIAFIDDDDGDFSWRRELARAAPLAASAPAEPAAPFQMIFTSGTTGLPKAVVQRHEMVADALCLSDHFGFTGGDVWMCVLPLFHVNAQYTSFFPALATGGRLVLFEKFSASRFFSTMREQEVSHVSVVPSLLTRLLSHGVPGPSEKPPTVRFVICGAAPLSAELHREFVQKTGIPIANGWGMTETGCWGSHMDPRRIVYGSMGKALSVNEMKIVDPETGQDLPPGAVGRLVVRGANVFREYFDAAEATAKAFRFGGGWFDTGDDARIDGEGFFYFVGRGSVDTGKVDGEFVNFLELDERLWSCPGLSEVCCVAVPDPVRGQAVAACVVAKPGASLSSEAVLAHCRAAGFARYEIPAHVFFVPEIPKGDTGKIQRKVMAERAAVLAAGGGSSPNA